MSEKRFTLSNFASPSQLSDVCDDDGKMLNSEVVDLLNEQQADLNYLAKFIGEFKVEEFKLKLRNLRMLEDKALKQQDLLNEQQSTIEAKNEYQRTLEAKIRRLKDRIKVLEKNE